MAIESKISRRTLVASVAGLAGGFVPAPASSARVRLTLAAGSIEIDLFTAQAPLSAGDFLKYVDRRDYDGGSISRVVRQNNDHGHPPIQVIQGGIRDNAKQYPPIAHETTRRTGLRHLDGTISIPRDKPGTGSGSAFFHLHRFATGARFRRTAQSGWPRFRSIRPCFPRDGAGASGLADGFVRAKRRSLHPRSDAEASHSHSSRCEDC